MEDQKTSDLLKSFEFNIVDVFAVGPMSGNQLAVVWIEDEALLEPQAPGEPLQRVAAEFGFSETVFVLDRPHYDGPIPVRIFTPEVELPFAGHPTLGAAWSVRARLGRTGGSAPERITLSEPVGPIETWFESAGADSLVWMRQNQPEFGALLQPELVASALRIETDDIDPSLPIQVVSTGVPFVIVPLTSLDAVQRASEHPELTTRPFQDKGVESAPWFVFCSGAVDQATADLKPDASYHARMFAAAFGIAEDPATGAANGGFAAYLATYGEESLSRPIHAIVEQGYEIERPSRLHLIAAESDGEFRIEVGGRVIPFATGRVG